MIPVAAVAMGAAVVEKHCTISRRLRGRDQYAALGPEGVWRMTRDIRNLEAALGVDGLGDKSVAADARTRLGRSFATRIRIQPGEELGPDNTVLLSPGDGAPWALRAEVYGHRARVTIPARTTIRLMDLYVEDEDH